jgi:hypothetical protein
MTDSSNNKTSHIVNSQLPDFVRRDHPLFVQFLESYYKSLEQDGGLMYVSKRFPDFYDIDTLNADYVEEGGDELYHILNDQYYKNFVKFIPSDSLVDRIRILKKAKDFYRSTGSEKSIRFLARILFNKEAKVYYPERDVLKASDGKWYIQKSLNIRDVLVDNVANSTAFSRFVNTSIRGVTSNSTATIESINPYYQSGVLITELVVTDVLRDFFDGETIYTTIEDQGVLKHLSANVYSGIIVSTTVTSNGSGYIEGAVVPVIPTDENGLVVSNGNLQFGFGGQVIIGKVAKSKIEGKIKSVTVDFPGAGYKVNDPLLFTGGFPIIPAEANIFSVLDNYTYHPAYYDIVGSTIDLVAGLPIVNAFGDIVQTQAYTNLVTQSNAASNLNISTIAGGTITDITLSKNLANSNVYFETGDVLFVQNTYQTILVSNKDYWELSIDPGLPGGLSNVSFTVFKKPNVNSLLANSMAYWTYGPCGPIVSTAIINPGSGYVELPSVSALSNTEIRSMGILGRMDIIDGGLGYQAGDQITFDNPYGTYGIGANAQVSIVDANGTITQVNFFAEPGKIPGGYGYRADMLPTANIQSLTGNGANIIVTATIGDNSVLSAKSNVIGSIASLKIISGGLGYVSAPILDLSTQGDGTAQAYANIVTGVYTYPGRYLDQAGQPSSPYVLQDRDYYQKYSYVVQIEESLNKYRKALTDLIHPAGLKVFGEYLFVDNNQTLMNTVNVINTSVQTGVNTNSLIVSFDSAERLEEDANLWYNEANTYQYAIISNTVSITSGGMQFNGANDTIIMPHANSLNVSNAITVISWFYQDKANSQPKTIVSKSNAGKTRGFEFFSQNNNLEVVVWPRTANNILAYSNTVNANTWHCAAFTYDGVRVRGYLNGVLIDMTPGVSNGATDTANSFYVGSRSDSSNTMNGRIGIVQVYNRALTNNDIISSFNRYRGRFGI